MNKDLLQRAGLEIFAIVFSVLLALFLNSWWQQSNINASHYKTLDLIETELRANMAELEEAIAYNKAISARILAVLPDGITEEEAKTLMEDCCRLESGGSHLTAHETAVLTGLYAWLEPDSATKIMSPFVAQTKVSEASLVLTNVVLTVDPTDVAAFVERYLILIQSMTPSMEGVLEETEKGLAEVERLKAAR